MQKKNATLLFTLLIGSDVKTTAKSPLKKIFQSVRPDQEPAPVQIQDIYLGLREIFDLHRVIFRAPCSYGPRNVGNRNLNENEQLCIPL